MTTKTIINKRRHNLSAAGVMLRPGENVMQEEKWRKLAGDKQAKLWFKLRWIGVKPAAAKSTGLAEELGGSDEGDKPMSAAEAIKVAAASDDVAALEGMLEGEDRKTVKAAIEKRLATLAEGADEGGGSDGGGEADDAGGEGDGTEAGDGEG